MQYNRAMDGSNQYVAKRDDGYWISNSRVSLDSIVIIIPQHLPLAVAVDELILIWTASDSREWENRICFLPL